MFLVNCRTYTSDNSDLALTLLSVKYRSKKYTKVKATLYNKHNGIVYETKNYKLWHAQISHWKVYDGIQNHSQ